MALAVKTPPADAGTYIYHLGHNDELFLDEFCTWPRLKQEDVLQQFSSSIRRIRAWRLLSKVKRVPLGRMGISKKCKTQVNDAMANTVNLVLQTSCLAAPNGFSNFAQEAHGSARLDGSHVESHSPIVDKTDFAAILSSLRRLACSEAGIDNARHGK